MTSRYQLLDRGVFDHQTRTIVTSDMVEWQAYREWLTAGGIPLPNDPIGQLPLSEAKRQKVEEINLFCAGQRNKIIQGRSAGEMASWAMKLLDALSRSTGAASPFAPIMPAVQAAIGLPTTPAGINDAMGMIRGNGETDYINKVMRDASSYISAEIVLDAIRGKHCDAIEACTTTLEVISYNWKTGWPVLP